MAERCLGVDWGGKRIGLAAGSSALGIARAKPNLEASGTLKLDAEAIAAEAKKEEAQLIVMGLPLLEGEETRMSSLIRRIGAELANLGWTVAYQDESLTSHASETDMRRTGMRESQVKRAVDGEAACRILERHWEAHG